MSMEESTLVNIAGRNSMRQQCKLQVRLTKEEFTTPDPTMICQPTNKAVDALKEVFTEIRKDAGSAQDVPSESNRLGCIFMNQCVGSATPQQR